jgi:hypothetical protein
LGFSFSSELALGDSDSTQPFSPSSVPEFGFLFGKLGIAID